MSSSQNTWQTGPVTAVLFDWDFTLAYSLGPNVSHVTRTTRLFQEYGVDCTEVQVAAAQAALEADIASGKMTGSLRPQKKSQIIRLYRELLRRLNHPDDGYDFAYEVYAGYGLLPHFLYDDVLPTLHALRARNLKLGILSNHSSSVRTTIGQLVGQIIPQTQITVSEEVGIHKPSKTIFQRAASKLHHKPAHCLYVGDNLTVDAKAAVQFGGYAGGVWINRYEQDPPQDLPAKVHHITNLAQLILLL